LSYTTAIKTLKAAVTQTHLFRQIFTDEIKYFSTLSPNQNNYFVQKIKAGMRVTSSNREWKTNHFKKAFLIVS